MTESALRVEESYPPISVILMKELSLPVLGTHYFIGLNQRRAEHPAPRLMQGRTESSGQGEIRG